MGGVQANQPVDHASRIRAAIDIIAERDDQVVGCRCHSGEQGFQRAAAPMNISNGEDARVIAANEAILPLRWQSRVISAVTDAPCRT